MVSLYLFICLSTMCGGSEQRCAMCGCQVGSFLMKGKVPGPAAFAQSYPHDG